MHPSHGTTGLQKTSLSPNIQHFRTHCLDETWTDGDIHKVIPTYQSESVCRLLSYSFKDITLYGYGSANLTQKVFCHFFFLPAHTYSLTPIKHIFSCFAWKLFLMPSNVPIKSAYQSLSRCFEFILGEMQIVWPLTTARSWAKVGQVWYRWRGQPLFFVPSSTS